MFACKLGEATSLETADSVLQSELRRQSTDSSLINVGSTMRRHIDGPGGPDGGTQALLPISKKGLISLITKYWLDGGASVSYFLGTWWILCGGLGGLSTSASLEP